VFKIANDNIKIHKKTNLKKYEKQIKNTIYKQKHHPVRNQENKAGT
jgi:hypothetical protein